MPWSAYDNETSNHLLSVVDDNPEVVARLPVFNRLSRFVSKKNCFGYAVGINANRTGGSNDAPIRKWPDHRVRGRRTS